MATQPYNRKLSVAEMMTANMRGTNGSAFTDPKTGRRLSNTEATARGPFTIAGWNTDSGRGRRGGYGSGPRSSQMGFYDEPRGGPAPMVGGHRGPLSPDYGASMGGLNEFYQNQQTMGSWDRLQNRAEMDMTDAIGSDMATQAREAARIGDYATAAQFADALASRSAQRMAAQGPMGGAGQATAQPQEDRYFYPGEKRPDAQGNIWRWNQQTGKGEMIQPAAPALGIQDITPPSAGTWLPGENLGEGQLVGQYGTGSVAQGPATKPATFTNAQGSSLGGVNFPGIQGTQTMEEFRQGAANRGNTLSGVQPEPGFAGRPFSSGLSSYADKLLQRKKSLGKA